MAQVREHLDVIEADLDRFHQLDLHADLCTPRLTWRRLRVLLRNLPRESAYKTATRTEKEAWTFDQHMLVSIFDALRLLEHRYRTVNFKGKPDRFRATPRPTDEKPSALGRGKGMTIKAFKALQRRRRVDDGAEVKR